MARLKLTTKKGGVVYVDTDQIVNVYGPDKGEDGSAVTYRYAGAMLPCGGLDDASGRRLLAVMDSEWVRGGPVETGGKRK